MSDCPGRFKCHGPASWCDQCGDVDLVCNDPRCDVHKRGQELEEDELKARVALGYANAEYQMRLREHQAANRKLIRYRTGNVIMVARLK